MSKPEPVPDRLSDPLDLQCEVVPTRFLEPVPLQVVNELLSELAKPAVGGILLGEVDPLPPQGQPGLVCATGSDDLLGRIDDDLVEVRDDGCGMLLGFRVGAAANCSKKPGR